MTKDIDVVVNDAYIPYMQATHKTQIFFGGSSSGKSFFLAQRIVVDVIQGANWMCCRNVAKTIRRSIYNEIIKAISAMNLTGEFSINKSDMVITCKANNKQILFAGLDDPEKIKSITPINGVLERVLLEEATEISRQAYKQVTKRLRGISDKAKFVVLAFNPILKTHWIYKEFFGRWEDNKNVYQDDKLLILKTTYKDNKFLTKEDREALEDETDPYYYNVYTLGNWGILGNVIFTNWHVEDLSELIPTFDNIYNGLDFGYARDPNALVRFHHDRKRKKIYIFDELYRAGMTDEDLLEETKSMIGDEYVRCDNADLKTIDYLAMHGVNAIPVKKTANSINRGIRWLQGYEIIVDVHCQNFKNEIEIYHWLEDKYGNAMAKAVDANNHLLDALRYAAEPLMEDIESVSVRRVR
ncbi:MAG: PBSX family phage terminase large subunit [Ruminococcus sp.]|nr:PBSX family phage terminase large subunit [Ruminococcus sp.]